MKLTKREKIAVRLMAALLHTAEWREARGCLDTDRLVMPPPDDLSRVVVEIADHLLSELDKS